MLKIGVVGVPDGWSSQRLTDAIAHKTGFRLLVEMDHVCYHSGKESIFFNDIDLRSLDALIIKKIGARYNPDYRERLELLVYLEKLGVKIFSPPQAIMKCFDRLSCTLTLRAGGAPMPDTFITEDPLRAEEAVKEFDCAVLKPLFSTKARGMLLLNRSDPDLKEQILAFHRHNPVIYIQKKVHIPGQDLGIAFLGGQYLATYARVAHQDSWNTTTAHGGQYKPYSPDPGLIQLAEKAQALFSLDFTSVDIVETADGPKVFEVSAFGGFRGLWDACHIDAADLYAQHVINALMTDRNKT